MAAPRRWRDCQHVPPFVRGLTPPASFQPAVRDADPAAWKARVLVDLTVGTGPLFAGHGQPRGAARRAPCGGSSVPLPPLCSSNRINAGERTMAISPTFNRLSGDPLGLLDQFLGSSSSRAAGNLMRAPETEDRKSVV